jgi:transcriptional regulator with XRE-family HTH domain
MIGKTIKFLRMAKGLTQADVAEELHATPNYISLVENDKREPSLSFLKDLAKILDVPVGLFFLDSDMSRKDITPQERALLMRIRDLMLQIEILRLESAE